MITEWHHSVLSIGILGSLTAPFLTLHLLAAMPLGISEPSCYFLYRTIFGSDRCCVLISPSGCLVSNVSHTCVLPEGSAVPGPAGLKGSCRVTRNPHAVASCVSYLIIEHH